MRKFAIAAVVLVVAGAIWCYNVLRADQEPVSVTPSAVQAGRQKLHEQLTQARQREAEIEQQDWNSVTLLRALITAHEQRIKRLTGNSEAGEILAYDRDAVARLQKRIDDVVAQESAQPATDQADAGSSASSTAPPSGTQATAPGAPRAEP